MRFIRIGSLSLAIILASLPAQAQETGGGGISQVLDGLFATEAQGCTQQVKINLGEAIRAGIEAEVMRADDVLKAPSSINALGCLDNLFDLDLDIAIAVPNLQAIFQNAVSQVQGQICQFAQDQISQLTAELNGLLELPDFQSLDIGGLSGGSSIDLDGPSLVLGGNVNSRGINVGSSSITENNLDRVFQQIYGTGAQ